MINVAEIIYDPDMAKHYTVYRQYGQWIRGKFIQNAPVPLPFYGPIIVADVKDLQQVPEADRVRGVMCFYSTEPIYVTHSDDSPNRGTSDQIEWRSELYRIYQVSPYADYGYYKAIGARMAGD